MDPVFCVNCGEDVTGLDGDDGRRPCPRCGSTARVITGRVGGPVTASPDLPPGSVIVRPATVEAVAAVGTPTIVTSPPAVVPWFEHIVRTHLPASPGDVYVLELVNPDTGPIDVVAGDDQAEAWRALADRYADDM